MHEKYVIHTGPVPHRFEPLARSGIIAWEEGCLKCPVCVKEECVYKVYDERNLDPRQMMDSIDNQCMNCLRCVQSCPKELIHKSINPEYMAMGDTLYTPDIIAHLWYQAETGKIPVSGAGYPGPFTGPGFDAMWTDMSEIVRPTRDGIHGREYISTAVDLGLRPGHLRFKGNGGLSGEAPWLLTIPLPVILKMPDFGAINASTIKGWAMASKNLGTLLALPPEMITDDLHELEKWLMPTFSGNTPSGNALKKAPLVDIPWSGKWKSEIEKIVKIKPSLLLSIKVPMSNGFEKKILSLAKSGVSIIHLQGSSLGRFMDDDSRYIKEGIRSAHGKLVEANIRDQVTLLVSGGMAMAEHVAKALICGADAVFVDFPILIALECRMCRRCTKGLSCPVEINKAPSKWITSRVMNLMGAWHNQLLEVMGAMGIRDARRLRGETGRAMFFEDLDRDTFGSMGKVKNGYELE